MSKKQPQVDVSWMVGGALCWIEQEPSSSKSFEQGVVESLDREKWEVSVKQGSSSGRHPCSRVLERVAPPSTKFYNGFEDMVNMETLNDAELLNNLVIRFQQDIIFTYVGPTLLVINPFKGIPALYLDEVKLRYIDKVVFEGASHKDMEPHIYAISAESYRCLFENDKNQAIVISGESGAGKTENAKMCMNLLTSIKPQGVDPSMDQSLAFQSDQPIEDKILGCNPILESFGNAKTVRNNNSSRFGKYVKIIVSSRSKKIKGAVIINYLLEKSRIVSQSKQERNFHIFYHLLSDEEERKKFKLQEPQKYRYLSTTYTAPGINDKRLFEEIQESMNVLGMKEVYTSIFQIVSAVLQFGNVDFDDASLGDKTPCSTQNLEIVSELLQIEHSKLATALTLRQRKVGSEVIQSPLPKGDCYMYSESIAKELYDRLFNWIVQKLNETIQPKEEDDARFVSVGLLDIFGFEVFEKNGFEQVMINYTNEKLQQLYISYVFKEEERVFIKEGLGQYSGEIAFHDNTPLIELIDKKIFALIDESCQVKSTNEGLIAKIRGLKDPLIVNPKMISNPTFILKHTAKDVEYNISDFRDKNKDELSVLAQAVMSESANDLVSSFFKVQSKGDKFLASKIKKEMQELMDELNSCDVHFVRCIKPNEEKKANIVSQSMTLNQIRYLGVLDSLRVRKESYPIRRNYQLFYKQFGDITKNKAYPTLIKEDADFKELTVNMFRDFYPSLDFHLVLMGQTKIFIKLQAMNTIQEVYAQKMEQKHRLAKKMQRGWKVYKLKREVKKFARAAMAFKQLVKRVKHKILIRKQTRAVETIGIWYAYVLKKRRIKKYKDSSKLFQLFIKRFAFMKQAAIKRKAASKIIRLSRFIKIRKLMETQTIMISMFDLAFEDAWYRIQSKEIVKIQAVVKGFVYRLRNKDMVSQIREVGRQHLIRKKVRLIQRSVRAHLRREKMKRYQAAAYYIQGYFRMRWLSDWFQRVRVAVVHVQRRVRAYLARRRAYLKKYEQFIYPWECKITEQKMQEDLWSDQVLDQALSFWKPKLPKMCLFAFPIDVDILSDLHEAYDPNFSYAKTLVHILIQQLKKDHPIQSIHVGEQTTICIPMGGSSLYEFGELRLIGKQNDGVERILFPETIRIRSLSISDQHTLVLTHDGTLIQFGDPQEQYSRNLVHHHHTTSITTSQNNSFLISKNKLYTWPVMLDNQFIRMPVQVSLSHKVKVVATGNQFAVLLCDGGQLYSWGENLEGELGHGDTIMRSNPTLITRLLHDKITQISCGLKHVASKSSLNRVYTWGWGEKGQLGLQDYKNEYYPKWVQLNAIWVSSGRTSTFLINDNKQLLWTGSNGTIHYQKGFEPINFEMKSNLIQQFQPIRVLSSYSKMIEITYITFANTTSMELAPNKLFKIIDKLIQYWSESNDPSSVDPPFNQSVSNYIYEASMRKPYHNFNRNNIAQYIRRQQEDSQFEENKKWMQRRRELEKNIQEYVPPPPQAVQEQREQKFSFMNQSVKSKSLRESEVSEIVDVRTKKLREIKKHLLMVEAKGEGNWNQQDVEFIQKVMSSKLHSMLQNVSI